MPPSPNMGGMHMTTTTCSWRPYRVALRTQECRGVISLYLEPTDGALPPAFAAGQYVELRMPGIEPHAFFLVGPSGDRLVRLTIEVGDEPFIGEVGRIAKLRIGDPVELSEPKGELAMEPGETPVVIMTEDIGCLVAHAFLAEMAEVEPMRNVRVLCQFPNGTRMLMRKERLRQPGRGLLRRRQQGLHRSPQDRPRQARHHSLPSSHAGPLSAFTRDGGRRSQTSPAPVKFVLADSVIFQNGLHFYLSVCQAT